MKTSRPYAHALLTVTAVVWGCGDDPLVGKDRCFGEQVSCDSDAPTLYEPDFSLFPNPFEVIPAGEIEQGLLYSLDESRGVVQLEAAPEGGVWALLGDTEPELHQLAADGTVVASHSVPIRVASGLTVDAALQPVISGWNRKGAGGAALNAMGELHAWTIDSDLHRGAADALALTTAAPGTSLVALFAPDESYVARYDTDSELLWQQTDVRDAREYPFADVVGGPEANYALVPLSDGALAVGVPKYVDNASGVTLGRVQGVTVLEPDGNVRWDVWFPSVYPERMLVQPGLDGGLLATYSTLIGNADKIVALSREGEVVASWTALRGDYSAGVSALYVDARGDVYAAFVPPEVAFIPAENDQQPFAICRMRSTAPEEPPSCRAVKGVDGESRLLVQDMVSPEPGVVALAYLASNSQSAPSKLAARIVRIEW